MNWVAIYAAVVATAALLWNVISWYIARQDTKRRELTRIEPIILGSMPEASGLTLFCRFVNRSEHAVNVMRVGIENNDSREAEIWGSGIRWYAGVSSGVSIDPPLPSKVDAKQGHEFELRIEHSEILRLDPAQPICLTASTEDGNLSASPNFDWAALSDSLDLN